MFAAAHGHGGLNGVGDEALLVRQKMQALLVGGSGQFVAAVGDLRMKSNRTHPRHTSVVLCQHANGLVMVAVHLETLPASQRQIREHVAARNCRDIRLLRVNAGRIRVGRGHNGRRRRGWHPETPVEAPGMLARILALQEFWTRALPTDGRFVLGHAENLAAPGEGGQRQSDPKSNLVKVKGCCPNKTPRHSRSQAVMRFCED